ncbi:hypothetical protein D3C73_1375090 [compost metagenome]
MTHFRIAILPKIGVALHGDLHRSDGLEHASTNEVATVEGLLFLEPLSAQLGHLFFGGRHIVSPVEF